MGVVHKLKPEIVEFIIQQKSEKHSLSCRKLADLVASHFQVKISKSSISGLLREIHLNNPVGRQERKKRPAKASSKKFKIPEQKKKSLFSAPKSENRPVPPSPSAKAVRSSQPKDNYLLLASELQKYDQRVKTTSGAKEKSVPDRTPGSPAGHSPSLRLSKALRYNKIVKSREENRHLGLILFLAMERELGERPVLSQILGPFLPNVPASSMDAMATWLMVWYAADLFSAPDPQKVAGDLAKMMTSWGWTISEDPFLQWERVQNEIRDIRAVQLQFAAIIPQLFIPATSVRLNNREAPPVVIDADGYSSWPAGFALPFRVATYPVARRAVRQLVTGAEPVVLASLPPERLFDRFWDIYFSTGEKNDANYKVEILDNKGNVLMSLPVFLQQPRTFVAGIFPWHGIFPAIVNQHNHIKVDAVQMPDTGKSVYFRTVEPKIAKFKKFRGFVLRTGLDTPPCGILLTNVPEGRHADQALIRQYICRWPAMLSETPLRNFVQRMQTVDLNEDITIAESDPSIDTLCEAMVSEACGYTLMDIVIQAAALFREYLSLRLQVYEGSERNKKYSGESIYNIPGALCDRGSYLQAEFAADEHSAQGFSLAASLFCLNTAEIRTASGKPVFFNNKA